MEWQQAGGHEPLLVLSETEACDKTTLPGGHGNCAFWGWCVHQLATAAGDTEPGRLRAADASPIDGSMALSPATSRLPCCLWLM